jgi:hypothetical protein
MLIILMIASYIQTIIEECVVCINQIAKFQSGVPFRKLTSNGWYLSHIIFESLDLTRPNIEYY